MIQSIMKHIIIVLYIIHVSILHHIVSAQTWSQTTAPAANWTSIASDESGTYLAAASDTRLYVSSSGY